MHTELTGGLSSAQGGYKEANTTNCALEGGAWPGQRGQEAEENLLYQTKQTKATYGRNSQAPATPLWVFICRNSKH